MALEEELEALPEQVKFYFERIQNSASRMQKLIKDILEYSKLNASEISLELTDLTTLVKEVKDDYEDGLSEKKATVAIGPLCKVNAVGFQLKRLFNNLISNSIKFADTGRPLLITVSSSVIKGSETGKTGLHPDRSYCHLVYSDNGIGFESHFNEKIFEVFQRLHNHADYAGTGIGLAICKRIVENHGGAINAYGELGVGTRFEIFLPV